MRSSGWCFLRPRSPTSGLPTLSEILATLWIRFDWDKTCPSIGVGLKLFRSPLRRVHHRSHREASYDSVVVKFVVPRPILHARWTSSSGTLKIHRQVPRSIAFRRKTQRGATRCEYFSLAPSCASTSRSPYPLFRSFVSHVSENAKSFGGEHGGAKTRTFERTRPSTVKRLGRRQRFELTVSSFSP